MSTTPWTPTHHASAHKTKPVRLLALGTGPHGKTALLEFPEGWQRTIDLPTQADAWHPLFDELAADDKDKLHKHTAHPIIRHADGTRTRQGALSFITQQISRNGGRIGERCFDVPEEDYLAGNITGYRCAGELLAALQCGYGPYIPLNNILDEAITVTHESFDKTGRRGAAVAFLEVVRESLTFMAKHARHTEFVSGRIARAEQYQAYFAESEASEKAAFVQRMKDAKAAKAQRANGGAA